MQSSGTVTETEQMLAGVRVCGTKKTSFQILLDKLQTWDIKCEVCERDQRRPRPVMSDEQQRSGYAHAGSHVRMIDILEAPPGTVGTAKTAAFAHGPGVRYPSENPNHWQ